MTNVQGGPAQPVQQSSLAPSSGPAIPVVVLTVAEASARGTVAGPYLSVVEVTDNRARVGGAALPVVLGVGNGFAVGGAPMPVYVVSGSFHDPSLLLETGGHILLETGGYILLES